MIKKLTEQNHELVMNFLKEEPSLNLFLIGDIEVFGYDTDFQELWGDFTESGELRGVLLRFYNSYIPYAKGDFDLQGFVEIIKNDKEFALFSGKAELVEKFEKELLGFLGKKQETYFCECTPDQYKGNQDISVDVKLATFEDIDQIIALRETIKEFKPNPKAKEMMVKGMESNSARTYYIKVDGKIVASASTTAENSLSAMIVGVCTAEGFRNKGYASKVLEKLMKDVLSEGKTLCLFYDNPHAGRIYKRLGFQDIGMWTMYR